MNRRTPSYLRPQQELRRQRARRRLAVLVLGLLAAVASIVVIVSLSRNTGEDAPDTATGPEIQAAVTDEPETLPPEDMEPLADDAVGDEELAAHESPELEPEQPELWGPPEPFLRLSGTVNSGDTFGTALDSAGVPADTVSRIIRTLRGTLDYRRIRPQDRFEILMTDGGELLEFNYERGFSEIYSILVSDGKWTPLRREREFERRLAFVNGVVESTLFEAVAAAGEQAELIMTFVEIFAWAVDFSVATRKGDRFTMVVEKLYDKDVFRGYGRIYTASYENAGEMMTATYFEAPDGFSGYFDEEGRSLRRAFLKTPLRFSAITSGFTYSRFHPVLKKRKPHLGVDYAAPTGTPIWSVADGVVIAAGWMGPSGKAVKIKHRNGYETSYSHLSRIAPGIKRGARVRQKQVIGKVGTTGRSTGPHLHFGMKVNGRAVNPASVKLPAGDPVPRKYLTQFKTERDRWFGEAARLQDARPAGLVPAAASR